MGQDAVKAAVVARFAAVQALLQESAAAGEISPRPVVPYRRLNLQWDQGRGRVKIQVHCQVYNHTSIPVPLLLIIRLY
jgi:hypothetical protein